MKYDELTAYKGDVTIPVYGTIADAKVYLKLEADRVIAELEDNLQAANEQIENIINSASSIMLFKDKINDTKCAEIENIKSENRRLKRALWIARANRADGEFIYWCARLAIESGFTKADIRGYSVNTKRKLRTIGEWIEVWKNVKSKCLKQAEEYK